MKVCLVTISQPSANPRLVKEADALVEAGHDVHVIAVRRVDWANAADDTLLPSRAWTCTFIDWRQKHAPALFWKTRLRHRLARSLQSVPGLGLVSLAAAVDRSTPEVTRAARRTPADLYVAHNAGALPAAAAAAQAHGALLGFDAEDFHSGDFAVDDRSPLRLAVRRTETRFIPRCDYITAAAPGIADAYAPLSRCGRPTTILNVFPLASRPPAFRTTVTSGPLTVYWFSQTIGPDRGIEDIVRAMGRLPAGSVVLHLRGRWHEGYADELGRVREAAGVPAAQLVSHASAHPDEMVRLASQYDVGLATETGATPNHRVALSNKIFTYLLAGVATLATRTPAQADLVGQLGDAAQSYEPGDVEGAVRALARWVDDRGLLERTRRAAWQAGEHRYNWDIEKREYLRVIDGVLGRHSAHQVARDAKPRIGELHV